MFRFFEPDQPVPAGPSSAARTEHDRGDNDDALHHDLLRRAEADQDQRIVERADQQRGDNRAEDGSLATFERRAADDGGGNDRQQVTGAEREVGGTPLAAIEHTGKSASSTARREHSDLDAPRADAREARRTA